MLNIKDYSSAKFSHSVYEASREMFYISYTETCPMQSNTSGLRNGPVTAVMNAVENS
jgi:hypothetical protein